MRSSQDLSKPGSSKQGHLASRRSDLYCAAVGVLTALLVALAGLWIIKEMQQEQAASLNDSTQRLGISVGRSVAQTVQLALGYGIPFDQLHGVSDYLAEVLQANPELAAIIIHDLEFAQRYELTSGSEAVDAAFHEPQRVTVWITHKGQQVGHVDLTLTGANTWEVSLHQFLLLMAATFLAGLATTIAIRILLAERWELPRAHLMASLSATARGTFADFSKLIHISPITQVADLAERARAPVRSRAREVFYLAEELRSIDIDGSLGGKVTNSVAEVEQRFRFERPACLELDRWWPGWLNLILLLVGTMTLPLIGGYAADRVGFNLLSGTAAAAALVLEALGGLLGLAAALLWKQAGAIRRLAHLIAMIAAAAATAWTFDLRDLTPFLLFRPVAAFAIWFTVFSVMQAPGRSLRGPWYCAGLLLVGLVLGPMLGSLLADGIGRRAAFLTSGVLVFVAGVPLSFFTYPAERARRGLAEIWRQGAMVAAGSTASAGIVAFYGGAVIDRHDYALLASFMGCIGIGFGLGLIVRRPPLAPWVLVLAIALIWLPIPINALLCGTLFFLGVALGLQISYGWRRPTGLSGLAAGLFGLGLGPAIAQAALYLGLGAPLWISALLAFPLLVSLFFRRTGRRSRRRG